MTVDITPRWAAGSEVRVFILAAMTPPAPTHTHIRREGRVEKKHLQMTVNSFGSL